MKMSQEALPHYTWNVMHRENLNARLQSDLDDENIPPTTYSPLGVNSTLTSCATRTQGECSNARKRPLQPSQHPNIMSIQPTSTVHGGNIPNSNSLQQMREPTRDRDRMRRERMTDQQREERNARGRSVRQNQSSEVRDVINEARRIARQRRPNEVREEVKARCRTARHNLPEEIREEMSANRRAARHNLPEEVREDMSDSRRVVRNNLPQEVREEMSANRRVARQNLPEEVREEMSASHRTARQNLPEEVRKEINASRRIAHARRRDIPCAESIAMPCPEDVAHVNNTQSTILNPGGDRANTMERIWRSKCQRCT